MVYYILLWKLKLFHQTKDILFALIEVNCPREGYPKIFKTYPISVADISHQIQKMIDISLILLTFKEN
jgi:hypothetical protein